MPQTIPKQRPGTRLRGLDRLLSKIARTEGPDRSGRTLGITWAAYRDPSGLGQGGYKVYALSPGGELMRRLSLRTDRVKRHDWHRADDRGAILGVLWKLYARQRDPQTPLEDLQKQIRRQTAEKRQRLRYEKRHAAALQGQRVRSETRPDGSIMNWIE